jgi:phage/plasmid-associated DNA primase
MNQSIELFVKDECQLSPAAVMNSADLWERYKKWCEDGGDKIFSRDRFFAQLRERFSVCLVKAKPSSPPVVGLGLK